MFLMLVMMMMMLLVGTGMGFEKAAHLATKTPLGASPKLVQVQSPGPTPDPTCRQVALNFLARHGARNPTGSGVAAYESLAAQMTCPLCLEQVHSGAKTWLSVWKPPLGPESPWIGQLDGVGIEEHFGLGETSVDVWGPLLPGSREAYVPSLWVVQDTVVARTSQSGSAFMQGVFSRVGSEEEEAQNGLPPVASYSNSGSEAVELRFFAECDAYQSKVKNNPAAVEEVRKWEAEMVPRVGGKIADALELDSGSSLRAALVANDSGLVGDVWQACQYALALRNESSTWCSLLDQESVLDLEFGADLYAYYVTSYGNTLNYHIASPLLVDFVAVMNASIEAEQAGTGYAPKAKLRFAHAETVMPFAALLGLQASDSPLTADMSAEQRANREFWTSRISPFAANIALILSECGGEYVVDLWVNHQPVDIPGCGPRCTYASFLKRYNDELGYDFDQLCDDSPTVRGGGVGGGGGGGKAGWVVGVIGIVVGVLGVGVGVGVWMSRDRDRDRDRGRVGEEEPLVINA